VSNYLTSLMAVVAPTTTAAKASKAGTSILDPIAKPIAWVLEHIYAVVPNFGVAILILSLIWMIIIAPLTLKSTRSMLAMQKLQPQLKKLQEQHRNDRQAFAQAQMELFREHNVSPFGACLPTLLPFPVFFALFRVIEGLGHTTSKGVSDPKYLTVGSAMYKAIKAAGGHLNSFGMDLSKNAFSHHSGIAAAAPYWILLLIMAGTGYLQTSQMMSRNPAASANPQMRMMKYLPLFFVVIFARLPAGVLVYYAMSNVCRIVQQDLMYRFDPKVKALVTREVAEVEAITHDIDEGRQVGKGAPTPKRPPANKPSPKPAIDGNASGAGPRSRFRGLLDAAKEQQQKQQPPAKSGGTKANTGAGDTAAKSAPKAGTGTGGNKAGAGTGGGKNGAGTGGSKTGAGGGSSGSGAGTGGSKTGIGTGTGSSGSGNGQAGGNGSAKGSTTNGSGSNGTGGNGKGDNGSQSAGGRTGAGRTNAGRPNIPPSASTGGARRGNKKRRRR
jgi:YidC/Oxa1 family membrane protein insertase